MKHKHYDMIVAKSANFELTQFIKIGDNWEIVGSHDNKVVSFADHYEYFLCLPQHKEACLHWLNGGDIQVRDFVTSPFCDVGWTKAWELEDYGFMVDGWVFRIKPKKEKRWIAVNPDGYVLPIHADSKESIRAHASNDTSRLTLGVQFIEIEVEV